MSSTINDRIAEMVSHFDKTMKLASKKLEDTEKKRLHVKLNRFNTDITSIFIRRHWGGESVVKKTLGGLWAAFGKTTDVYYNDEYAYCFLSFSTHAEAKKVLDDLNDKQKVETAAKALVKAQPQGQAQKAASQILTHLVANAEFFGARASWAHPKRETHDYRYSDDIMEYYDDCPDGEDRFVWNEYCAGRD